MGDLSDAYGGNAFNPNEHEAESDFAPLPPGDYHAFVEKAEVKETKKGDGSYLKLQLSITGEKYDGRKVFDNINLSNPNQKCVEIGIARMSALGQALGLTTITDSSELLEKIIIIKLKVKPAEKDKYGNVIREAENEVRAYKPANGTEPTETSPVGREKAQQQEKPAETGKSKPPWER